jgi:hypothetical protein
MRYSAEGLNYPGAIALIKNLRDAGIEASVSVGGVGIWCETKEQVDTASQICLSHQSPRAVEAPGFRHAGKAQANL